MCSELVASKVVSNLNKYKLLLNSMQIFLK